MNWRNSFNEAIKAYFSLPADALIISTTEDKVWKGGGCPTCSYESIEVTVLVERDGEQVKEVYYGSMVEFMNSLDNF